MFFGHVHHIVVPVASTGEGSDGKLGPNAQTFSNGRPINCQWGKLEMCYSAVAIFTCSSLHKSSETVQKYRIDVQNKETNG